MVSSILDWDSWGSNVSAKGLDRYRIVPWCALVVFLPTVALAATPVAVPTFHSIGLYWSPDGGASGECEVQYRPVGGSVWRTALPLWLDERNGEYRGSVVNLSPGTPYEIRLTLSGPNQSVTLTASTWREDFPIARVVYLPEQSSTTLQIDQSGAPGAYILYTGPGGRSTIDVKNREDNCIEVMPGVSHVVVRGLTLRGAREHAVRLREDVHDVVLEENDISAWGAVEPDGWAADRHSAIYAGPDTGVERLIVQRNAIHHPRGDSNSWEEYRSRYDTSHPMGPRAIYLAESKGNHVIRYNDIYSDEDHYFADIVGGASNFSFRGFPHRDTDIYANSISHCWDDGIESEGANTNVRIWGNYIDRTFVKIAIASTSIGPLYIWRNIADTSRRSPREKDSDAYGRGPFLKAGGVTRDGVWYGSGRTYVFHNVVLQSSPPPDQSFPLGSNGGVKASGGDVYELITRNNIFTNYKNWHDTFEDGTNSCTNSFDYDLYTGDIGNECATDPHQRHGLQGIPVFDPANRQGEYALVPGSPGHDAGVIIRNFNDDYQGRAPDVGAFERSSAPMQFGVNAYRK